MKFALAVIETEASRRHVRERRADHRVRTGAWMGEQARTGKVVGGEAFQIERVGPVTVRRTAEAGATVTEGPVAGEDETLGGYRLVDVADRDEDVALATRWPTEETIEVRPVWVTS